MHLEGFADTTGDSAANLVLSAKRAEAVKNYLMEQGVDPTQGADRGPRRGDRSPARQRARGDLPGLPPAKAAMAEAEPAPPAAPERRRQSRNRLRRRWSASSRWSSCRLRSLKPRWERGFGWALMAGGGYQDFTKDTMRSVTDGGGYWDARFIGGTNSIIGFEAAYVGSARSIRRWAPRPTTRRWCRTASRGTSESTPRCGGARTCSSRTATRGSGTSTSTSRTTTRTPAALSSFTPNDSIMTVPVGGGFAYAYKAFIMDARAGWTATYLPGPAEQGGLEQHAQRVERR